MQPIYTTQTVRPAYQLNWGVTIFWRVDPIPFDHWLPRLQALTEPDGVRILRCCATPNDGVQFFVSTKPHVSPAQIVHSLKGRLQHSVRDTMPQAFRRNYDVHSIGSANREVIHDYVANQQGHHRMADPMVQQNLKQFQKDYGIDLSQARFSAHGRFIHNLHVVIVNDERWNEVRVQVLGDMVGMIEKAAAKHHHLLAKLSALADHLHFTIGCGMTDAPGAVALSYLNNCAYALAMKPAFQYGYYVGTFGEYDRGAVT